MSHNILFMFLGIRVRELASGESIMIPRHIEYKFESGKREDDFPYIDVEEAQNEDDD